MSTIHVAACCDENYAPYALVMMLSALRASQSSSLHFHFIDCGLSELSVQRMVSAIQAEGGQVEFYQPNSEAYDDLPTHRYGGAVYHRINLPDYLPSSLKRVIYIDSDTLVVKGLQPLWSFDLEGKPLAAVENFSPFACRDLGVSRDSYFNSGVLVIDLDAWRREGLHHQVNRYAREHAHKLQYVDQCSLNAVFVGRWAKLPAIWNQQSDIFKTISKYQSGCGYSAAELDNAAYEPGIVHFTGKKKPWLVLSFHPYKQRYRELMAATPWQDQPAKDEGLRTRLRHLVSFRQRYKARQRQAKIRLMD